MNVCGINCRYPGGSVYGCSAVNAVRWHAGRLNASTLEFLLDKQGRVTPWSQTLDKNDWEEFDSAEAIFRKTVFFIGILKI